LPKPTIPKEKKTPQQETTHPSARACNLKRRREKGGEIQIGHSHSKPDGQKEHGTWAKENTTQVRKPEKNQPNKKSLRSNKRKIFRENGDILSSKA